MPNKLGALLSLVPSLSRVLSWQGILGLPGNVGEPGLIGQRVSIPNIVNIMTFLKHFRNIWTAAGLCLAHACFFAICQSG